MFAFNFPGHILIFELNPAASDVDKSKNLNYNAIIGKLKWSCFLYLAKAEDVTTTTIITEWWINHSQQLPVWSSACKSILLLQPSSATAERVFSLLSNSFSDQQTLPDYIEISIILLQNNSSN